MDIVWLGEEGANDITKVGGKVSGLARLAVDYRVPPGFCVTTEMFGRLGPADSTRSNVPRAFRETLASAYAELSRRCSAPDPAVAVRSSAVGEDGESASFAGQYETFLNVRGIREVQDRVVACWHSTASERVQAYGARHGVGMSKTQIAVLVQQLVASDVSAVVFSANPINGRRDEIVINASWGLGESVVGGTVTPDTYYVRKSDMQISERQVGHKTRMTVSVPGGTREVDVPRFLVSQPALEDGPALEAAAMAAALEARMGFPVDIECAFYQNRLYLLQCRPITTLGG